MALVILALVGCTTPTGRAPVPVAPGIALSLPVPGELGRSVELVQLVTARRGGESFVFEGRLSAQPGSLVVISSDMMGRRAMTIRWNGVAIEAERADWMPASLRPENVLADIMLIYWPAQSLARALGPEVRIEESPGTRRISRDGKELIAIRYDGPPLAGTATLTNLAWSYEIEVRSSLLRS
jgi:hypothetical protein